MEPKIPFLRKESFNEESKINKFAALGMGFSNTEKSLLQYGETLWNILGRPYMEGDYMSVGYPIGDDMSITAERGRGLYGQFERPDLMREPEKDFRFTLSKLL